MSTTAEQHIKIPAEAIEDVRLGAISEMATAADTLHIFADRYAEAERGKREPFREGYSDAFDEVQRMQALLEQIGDDLDVHEPIEHLSMDFAPHVRAAAEARAAYWRDVCIDGARSTSSTTEMRAILDRIDLLDAMAGQPAVDGEPRS